MNNNKYFITDVDTMLNKKEPLTNSTSDTSDTNDSTSDTSDSTSDNNKLYLEGQILNHYNIIYQIGKGGYSTVWLVCNINDHKFYALKVHDHDDYDDSIDEVKFVKTLPTEPNCFNNIVEYFIKKINNKKYICSIWNLHASNLDSIIRKGNYNNGLPLNIVNNIMKQLIKALDILHNKYKVFHGDIKPDNIFLKGINQRDQYVINSYIKENFFEQYVNAKRDFWNKNNKNIKNIDKMKIDDKINIRTQVHSNIVKKILANNEFKTIQSNNIELTLENSNISLGDFGTYCTKDNYYEDSFGTRYYQAPEIILNGKTSYPVDIWALGCTYYELLSGKILFDPTKDKNYSRDYYHLCLITETFGSFSSTFLKSTKKYKEFFNKKFILKDYSKPDICRLDRKLNESNLGYIKQFIIPMLKVDPKQRVTIKELHNTLL